MAALPRLRLFEFHESAWFPGSLRNAITEVLRVMCFHLGVHEVILPVLVEVLERTGTRRIIDLCSGAGGPVVPIQQELARSGRRISVLLTDKFPNADAFHRCTKATGGAVEGHMEPVDVTRVPVALSGLRTFFNCFHHFSGPQARAILADAYRRRQPIAIFEITERSPLNTLANFPLSFLTMLALLPRMECRRPAWWLFTYLVPLLPLAFGWDASISCLRCYTAEEFQTLKAGLEDESYSWTLGRLPVPRTPIHVNYFIGMPAVAAARAEAGLDAIRSRARYPS
jgi:hypothetical protein